MRPECAGIKDDHSDRCDLYDSEGYCHWYGSTWLCEKDGQYHGGEDVECITYCTKRRIKGKRINDSMNPLHMERLPRYFEVIFDGEIRSNVEKWGDGRIYDPVSNRTLMPDGTMLDGKHTSTIDDWITDRFEKMEKDGTLDKLRKTRS